MLQSKKRLFTMLVGALCVIVGLASVAFANGKSPGMGWAGVGAGIGRAGTGGLMGGGMGLGFMRRSARTTQGKGANQRLILAYISGKTGTPLDTLLQELRGGKTLEEIAAGYGVDLADIEANVKCDGFLEEMSVERLEAAIDRVTDNRTKMAERIEDFESKIPEYEAKIAEMEDETLRDFATRRLDIMKQRWGLGADHLSIMDQRLELLQDELDYAKSR